MLDRALTQEDASFKVSVENARDMLAELIAELEKKPVPPQTKSDFCTCEHPVEKNDGTCGACGLPIDYKNLVL